MNTLLRAAAMAGGLIALPALSANNSPGTSTPNLPKAGTVPPPATGLPTLPVPSIVSSMNMKLVRNDVHITVNGTTGDQACGLLIQRYPLGAWDPVTAGKQGVVVVVGKSQSLKLPFTVPYGVGKPPMDTVAFSVKGVAVNGLPGCAGEASYNYDIPKPPPPPDVSS